MIKERNTEQKEILIEYLKNNANEHLTVQKIYTDLKDKIGMTTIYRIIKSLTERGIVTKIPMENKQGCCYRYDIENEECSNHYHLICEKCNNLVHFESKEIPKVSKEAKKNEDFEIDSNRIVFYGICKNCKGK
ncbi:MAG: transcriptional repressor [Clostridia bacterium]|nr:transcriptional repressor [Clostridia bacterium]